MKQVLFKGEEIKELIPQRTPIMMVDTFYDADDANAHTGLTIASDNIFCRNGKFTEPGLIEHIAQSASAFAGYSAKKNNLPTPIGFIGEVKKFRPSMLPDAGSELHTRIHIVSEVMNITLLQAETTLANGEIVATCQMKISIEQ